MRLRLRQACLAQSLSHARINRRRNGEIKEHTVRSGLTQPLGKPAVQFGGIQLARDVVNPFCDGPRHVILRWRLQPGKFLQAFLELFAEGFVGQR
jgi:hypothetical protein